jgi:UDP-N-acetylmuramate-alanine ligase
LASNTMQRGFHKDTLAAALKEADSVHLYTPETVHWNSDSITNHHSHACAYTEAETLFDAAWAEVYKRAEKDENTPVFSVIMSNGSVGGLLVKQWVASCKELS